MKAMIQIPVTVEAADAFVRQLSMQGYEPVDVPAPLDPDLHDIHFVTEGFGGKISINYSVTIYRGEEPYAFIGVRPE